MHTVTDVPVTLIRVHSNAGLGSVFLDETTSPVSTLYLKVLEDFVNYEVDSKALLRALDESASYKVIQYSLDEVEKSSTSLRTKLRGLANT